MSPPRLLLATGNAKKAKELHELAAGRFDVVTLRDVGLDGLEIVEDGATFADNAQKKVDAVTAALPAAQRAGLWAVLGDDSGLAVDFLAGRPGVRSARFARDHGYAPAGLSVDAANNRLLLTLLAPVPAERRGAQFECAVSALVLGSGRRAQAYGVVRGAIATDELGGDGFGYDPLFLPVETPGRRMAELASAEKHAISHRGRAMRALLAQLS